MDSPAQPESPPPKPTGPRFGPLTPVPITLASMLSDGFLSMQIPLRLHFPDLQKPLSERDFQLHVAIHIRGTVSNFWAINTKLKEVCPCLGKYRKDVAYKINDAISHFLTEIFEFARFHIYVTKKEVPKDAFKEAAAYFWRRLLSIIAHFYIGHYEDLWSLKIARITNTSVKHFFLWSRHFGLLDEDDSTLLQFRGFHQMLLDTPSESIIIE